MKNERLGKITFGIIIILGWTGIAFFLVWAGFTYGSDIL